MAMDVFSCPATSVDVERLFSRAGRVVSPLRHKLKAAKIAQLVTVGKWFVEGSVPDDLLPNVLTEEDNARRAKRKAKALAADGSGKRSKPNAMVIGARHEDNEKTQTFDDDDDI
ncbi:hypothetical protein A4X06_0g4948 [Tilletia controversa]|uniref:HAT C-terminal dimerisation domain-containing protein n=1 Tax=Tilletia controversa TaxID=13291 RepID=A0A8X7MRV8_9BASI|nr:hypothetical protein A4X06_0g4948 [Tilletia controversa]